LATCQKTYKGTEEDVDNANEQLGTYHALPEIQWMTHFSEEGNKEESTTPTVYDRVSFKSRLEGRGECAQIIELTPPNCPANPFACCW
jgi:hypothetical protein